MFRLNSHQQGANIHITNLASWNRHRSIPRRPISNATEYKTEWKRPACTKCAHNTLTGLFNYVSIHLSLPSYLAPHKHISKSLLLALSAPIKVIITRLQTLMCSLLPRSEQNARHAVKMVDVP
jgi:hypothetical protein